MNGVKKTDTKQNGIEKGKANLEDLRRMIEKVKKETKWRDIHKIVDEALKRLGFGGDE